MIPIVMIVKNDDGSTKYICSGCNKPAHKKGEKCPEAK